MPGRAASRQPRAEADQQPADNEHRQRAGDFRSRPRAEQDEKQQRSEEQPDDEGGVFGKLGVDPTQHAADEPAGNAAHPGDPPVDEKNQ